MKHRADWSPGADIRVLSVNEEDGRWLVSGESSSACACPTCKQPSRVRHGRYSRDLQDLPAQGRPVVIRVSVQRWRCGNALCRRQTFGSRAPETACFAARRTRRVFDLAGYLGHAAGGRPAHRLTARLGLTMSRDTILRALNRRQQPAPGALRVVGIDDWSWRKGSTYGTLIVDLEHRRVVDLLPNRRADTTARWLGAHPEIEVISRDRCGLYAVGAAQGAPQARQVADRFHLIQNLRDVIERQLSRGPTRMLAQPASCAEPPAARPVDDPRPRRFSAAAIHRNADRDARRAVRVARFVRVKELADVGLSLNDIVRETGFSWRSVSKWTSMEVLAPRRRASPTHPTLAAYDEHLSARWAGGARHGVALLGEIKAMGYSGSRASFYRLLAMWKRRDRCSALSSSVERDPGIQDRGTAELPVSPPEPIDPATGHLISPITAAAICIKPRGMLSPRQVGKVAALKASSDDFVTMRRLAMRFRAILRRRDPDLLMLWIDDARHCGLHGMKHFARVLLADLDAVRNAVSEPWSNGQVEGQINRLKTIKRSMYGRAGVTLLRARLLAFNPSTSNT
jgi:transposase